MEISALSYFDKDSELFQTNKNFFYDFLQHDEYQKRVDIMLRNRQTRLPVNIDDIRTHNKSVSDRLLAKAIEFIGPFQVALREYIQSLPDTRLYGLEVDKDTQFEIGFEGEFGANKMTPRGLTAEHVGRLVCIEGIATKCSAVRPKVIQSEHSSDKNNRRFRVSYHDNTSLTGFPTGSSYPTKDEEGHPLSTEYGLSEYHDHQTLAIQEMPESAPTGMLPCSVEVILNRDICDACKPGDRVSIVGVFKPLPSLQQGETTGNFRTVLIANSVGQYQDKTKTFEQVTPDDLANIKTISTRKDLFNLVSGSVAPSIYGHQNIKKALLLMLLGGCERNLPNGTHIRGDINVLMVGDPSTAKSQLLRYVLNIAPLSINTTGRGSSGVGLTAAVTHDRDSGERRLEAGAMVLADRGVVCIDEFDKMSDADRVAIHEVMEQQTVTIAKAGIQMSLNARCSVVAAANPVYGKYDVNLKPHQNVGLQDSLLSRFDLLFIVLDVPDSQLDKEIASRVLNNHRFLKDSDDRDNDVTDNKPKTAKIFQLTQKGVVNIGTDNNEVLTIDFLKKYISVAKNRFDPKLTEEASVEIGKRFAEMRMKFASNNEQRSLPITARSLETIIRLSSAHAKLRLSETVDIEDCKAACLLMMDSLDAAQRPDLNRQNKSSVGDDDDTDDDDDEPATQLDQEDFPEGFDVNVYRDNSREQRRQLRSQKRLLQEDKDDVDVDSDNRPANPRTKRVKKNNQNNKNGSDSQESSVVAQLALDEATVVRLLSNYRRTQDVLEMTIAEAVNYLGENMNQTVTEALLMPILTKLDEQNKIMIFDGSIHFTN